MAKAKRRFIVAKISMFIKVYGCDECEKASVHDQEQNLSLSYGEEHLRVKELIERKLGHEVANPEYDIMASNSELIKRIAREDMIYFLPKEYSP